MAEFKLTKIFDGETYDWVGLSPSEDLCAKIVKDYESNGDKTWVDVVEYKGGYKVYDIYVKRGNAEKGENT